MNPQPRGVPEALNTGLVGVDEPTVPATTAEKTSTIAKQELRVRVYDTYV